MYGSINLYYLILLLIIKIPLIINIKTYIIQHEYEPIITLPIMALSKYVMPCI